MSRAGIPIARIAPIWRTSSSSLPRTTNRITSSAIAISRAATSTSATAASPSLIACSVRIIV